jgi:hypothetical protein
VPYSHHNASWFNRFEHFLDALNLYNLRFESDLVKAAAEEEDGSPSGLIRDFRTEGFYELRHILAAVSQR